MRSSLKIKDTVSPQRACEILYDLWLVVDALVEPGLVRVPDFPRPGSGCRDRGLLSGEERLGEVRCALDELLRIVDLEVQRLEWLLSGGSRDSLSQLEMEQLQETREDLRRLRSRVMAEIATSLAEVQ